MTSDDIDSLIERIEAMSEDERQTLDPIAKALGEYLRRERPPVMALPNRVVALACVNLLLEWQRFELGCEGSEVETPKNPSRWQPYWKPGDLFCFWNYSPNTVYVILRFHKSRRTDEPVDWRERKEAIAADVQAANLGDGTLKRVPVVILDGAQVSKVKS